jgi:ketosteroid isomerase-like protein
VQNAAAMQDEARIRTLIENWAKAVRARDVPGVVADHAADILMFDVPPPAELRGIEAYERSWGQLFRWFGKSGAFAVEDIVVHAGADVAFATARIRCSGEEADGSVVNLDVRLTVGLRMVGGRWSVVHEHHSVAAE